MKNVLIIDDEEDLCSLMKNILQTTSLYNVSVAHDGRAGERMALNQLPDLIFLDFVMPEEKGDKVIACLKKLEATKKIPIILMSGLGEMVYFGKRDQWKWLPNTEAVKHRGDLPKSIKWKLAPEDVAKELGISAYLSKPFTGEILLELTKSILKQEKVEEKVDF